jgi:hypothetical protein
VIGCCRFESVYLISDWLVGQLSFHLSGQFLSRFGVGCSTPFEDAIRYSQ